MDSDMTEVFKGVQTLNDKMKADMLKSSLIVLDTNILLDIFRYKLTTTNEFFDALQEYKSSLWLPYQVGVEFFRNKDKVSSDYSLNIKSLVTKIDSAKNTIENDINNKKELIPELNEVKKLLAENSKTLKAKLEEIEKKYKKEYDDFNFDKEQKIVSLFENRITNRPSEDLYEQIIIEGDRRIRNKIAPGYKDSKKQDYYKDYKINGDYIIFASMIELAKAKDMDVIFISGDVKEDWLNEDKSNLKYCLQLEFYEKTNHRILYLNKNDFIKFHNKISTKAKISRATKKEIISSDSNENDKNFTCYFQYDSEHDSNILKYFKELYKSQLKSELKDELQDELKEKIVLTSFDEASNDIHSENKDT